MKIVQDTSCALEDLRKFTNYTVQVLAFTKEGEGPTSTAVFAQTLPDGTVFPHNLFIKLQTMKNIKNNRVHSMQDQIKNIPCQESVIILFFRLSFFPYSAITSSGDQSLDNLPYFYIGLLDRTERKERNHQELQRVYAIAKWPQRQKASCIS